MVGLRRPARAAVNVGTVGPGGAQREERASRGPRSARAERSPGGAGTERASGAQREPRDLLSSSSQPRLQDVLKVPPPRPRPTDAETWAPEGRPAPSHSQRLVRRPRVVEYHAPRSPAADVVVAVPLLVGLAVPVLMRLPAVRPCGGGDGVGPPLAVVEEERRAPPLPPRRARRGEGREPLAEAPRTGAGAAPLGVGADGLMKSLSAALETRTRVARPRPALSAPAGARTAPRVFCLGRGAPRPRPVPHERDRPLRRTPQAATEAPRRRAVRGEATQITPRIASLPRGRGAARDDTRERQATEGAPPPWGDGTAFLRPRLAASAASSRATVVSPLPREYSSRRIDRRRSRLRHFRAKGDRRGSSVFTRVARARVRPRVACVGGRRCECAGGGYCVCLWVRASPPRACRWGCTGAFVDLRSTVVPRRPQWIR